MVRSDAPLFPDEDGGALAKNRSIALIRLVLEKANITMTRLGNSGYQEQRFHGHCLRVSGTQFLARNNVPLHTVLLIGRWSSRAVERYVQEAALMVPAQRLLAPKCQFVPVAVPPVPIEKPSSK